MIDFRICAEMLFEPFHVVKNRTFCVRKLIFKLCAICQFIQVGDDLPYFCCFVSLVVSPGFGGFPSFFDLNIVVRDHFLSH